jgi:hypothetical protein
MLRKYDEELELLENLLRGPKSEKEITTREEKCSQVPCNEEVFTTSKKTEVNFKFQTDYEVAGIESDDEHEVVIREIESKLFLEDEVKPQVQHSELMFRYFEKELRFLEEWLARDPGEKDYIKNEDLVQANYEKKIRVPYNSGMDEEEMQQLVGSNNNKFQQRSSGMYQQEDKLDMEIDEMWMLMVKVPKRKYTEVRRIVNNRVQLTVQVCINKASGQLQHKIWRPGELKTTTIQKQGNNASKKQQHKIWDPGRWRITVKTTECM